MKTIRALLVGGKKDYRRAYEKLQQELLSVFNIEAEWDQRGKKPITADRYDIVLLSTDILGHNTSARVTAAAERAGIPTHTIGRKWAKTFITLRDADFEIRKPDMPRVPTAAPQRKPATPTTPTRILPMPTSSSTTPAPALVSEPAPEAALFEEAELPAEVQALVEQVRAACEAHRVTALVFDLSAGEVEFEQEVVRTVRGTYTLKEAA